MTQFSLRARWVLPVDGAPVPGGVVTIAGERIVAVGQAVTADTIDMGDVVLLPGLVNAHTHLEFTDCQKPLGRPGMPLPEWIRQVIGTRHRADRDPSVAIALGLSELVRSGVTTIGEISTTSASAYAAFSGSQIALFQEVIGFSAARRDSVEADLCQRIDAGLAGQFAVGISPHAPYTVHPELLNRLVSIATEQNLPVAMHLAESREELELLQTGTGPFQQLLADRSMWDAAAIPAGSTPLNYLRMLAEAPRALVIHGNYLVAEEIGFLGKHREKMSVVFCPRTHDYFGHETYPLSEMLSAGVRVALGTDSRASNHDLSLLNEMRFVATRFPQVPAETLLQMGTAGGAEALGFAAQIGTLTPGKLADLVAIPCPADADPWEAVLHSSTEPSHVFVRGREIDL